MKVLQTIGKEGGVQAGVFQYKRSSAGVTIDTTVGNTTTTMPAPIVIPATEWDSILKAIETHSTKTFTLSEGGASGKKSLYEIVQGASSVVGKNINLRPYVCAILEHEGSIDFYHGVIGQGKSVFITLSRDI